MKKIIFLFFMAAMSTMCSKDDCRDQCPIGYTGCDCDQERTPVSITITRITLISYPEKNGGQPWDDFSQYADPYVQVSTLLGTVYESPRKDEVPFNVPVSWDMNVPMDLQTGFLAIIYDFDSGGPHSIICAASVNTWRPDEGFPTTKTFSDINKSGSTIRVEYTYQF